MTGLAKRRGIEVIERRIMPDELSGFEECFISGTGAEVTPVREIGPYSFTPGAMSRAMIDYYSAEGRTGERILVDNTAPSLGMRPPASACHWRRGDFSMAPDRSSRWRSSLANSGRGWRQMRPSSSQGCAWHPAIAAGRRISFQRRGGHSRAFRAAAT
jgi:hypothetical protein